MDMEDDPDENEEHHQEAKDALKMHDGWSARLVQHRYFERATLLVITFNAVWIGVDLEGNKASVWTDAEPVYAVADNFFCAFFTFEVLARFCAFRNKKEFWKDKSYDFDLVLVFFMLLEWAIPLVEILSGGGNDGGGNPLKQLSILRLLRLLRLTRMARLMRSMPELMTLMKGLVNALRSVFVTFVFLLGIMWVFAIIFFGQYKGAEKEGLSDDYFHNLFFSMLTLFINGTLMDELTSVAMLLMHDSTILMILWFVFVLMSSLTVLNMLIGVLTDVVGKTAEEEKRHLARGDAKKTLKRVFDATDTNGNDRISIDEFQALVDRKNDKCDPRVMKALSQLGIQEDRLKELAQQLFYSEGLGHALEDEPPDSTAATSSDSPSIEKSQTSDGSPTSKGKAGLCSKVAWVQTARELTFQKFMDELLLLVPKPGGVCVREMAMIRRETFEGLRVVDTSIYNIAKEIRYLGDELSAELAAAAAARTTARHAASVAARLAEKEKAAQKGDESSKRRGSSHRRLGAVPMDMLLQELSKRLENRSTDRAVRSPNEDATCS
jgi:hypothetical protein